MGFKYPFSKNPSKTINHDVAIIGIACRFPGAANYSEFWENLQNGVNSIREIPPDRWDINATFSTDRSEANKTYCKWAGIMHRVDTFDAMFFKTTPHEAVRLDPQQRLIMEETWHCIEDSGIALKELQRGNTSVHIGLTRHDYIHYFFEPTFEPDGYAALAYSAGVIANRISYFLNLTGESQIVDAACASSLVCIHNGIQMLLNGESQYALAGAVSVICHPWTHIACAKAGMYSPEGQCKTFDAEANGYVPGEGVAVLLLETYDQAIKNGHHIYGVIKGSAVHHSGKTKSITAPKIEAQRGVIEEAIASAQIDPETISYLEAHGTGTSLGDPIEVEALTQAFATSKKQYCAIGSVKSNIGHLESAAGMASIIKVLMMLKHKKIVKTLNIKTPNPIIDFANSPFKLAEQYQDWNLPEGVEKRIAGISSFGFGGVDAHVIVEEYQAPAEVSDLPSTLPHAFILSTKSEESMKLLLKKWQEHSKSKAFAKQNLGTICETLMHGKESFNYRFAATLQSKRELRQLLINLPIDDLNFSDTSSNIQQKTIVLRIKSTPELQFSTFTEACQLYQPLQNAFNNFKSSLLQLRGGKAILRNLTDSKNPKFSVLRAFLSTYIPLMALLPAAVSPRYLVGNGLGELVESVEAGMVDITEIIQWLTSAFPSLHIHRPRIALYDQNIGKAISPIKVSKEYCKKLIAGFAIDPVTANQIISQSKAIYQNQFTFKKLLQDYNPVFEICGINLDESLELRNTLDAKNRNIFTLLLTLATKILINKWNLPEKIHLDNNEANELLNLLSEGFLRPEDFVALVLNDSDVLYEEISAKIQQALASASPQYEYNILQQMSQQIDEIPNPETWLRQMLSTNSACDNNLPDEVANPWYVNIGGVDDDMPQGQPFLNIEDLVNSLPAFLIDLWQNGIDIDWELWYPKTASSKTCPLPVYPFLAERYWLETTNPPLQQVAPVTNLSEQADLIAKCKIDGQAIALPGTYIELIRNASSEHLHCEVNQFKDLSFIYPKIPCSNLHTHFSGEQSNTCFQLQAEENAPLCEGIIAQENSSLQPAPLDLTAIKARCPQTVPFNEVLQKLNDAGLEQDESWHVNGQIWRNETEILAELSSETKASAQDKAIDPTLFNASLLILFTQLPSMLALPWMMRSLKIYRGLQGSCFVWVNTRQDNPKNLRHDYDLSILSPQGEPLIQIEGVLYKEFSSLQKPRPVQQPQLAPLAEGQDLQKQTEIFLQGLASKITKIPKEKFQPKASFADFGIDSLMVMRFNDELGKIFPNLRKTILYEHQNLESLATYFVKNKSDSLLKIFQTEAPAIPATAKVMPLPPPVVPINNLSEQQEEAIAIIGLSGRFPQAENLAQYWENLKSGRNCITDVPADRWPVSDYAIQLTDKLSVPPGKIYCNRGGFIDGANCFDAEFFNISPKDAAYMDPQERVFFESVYSCIEAAGYQPDTLLQNPIPARYSPRVGVFAGVSFNLYPLLYTENSKAGYAPIVNAQTFSAANRISYFFNFTGPSFTIDTACSSSLYAIHLACESIRHGECTLAIAGGTNLSLHPAKYATLSATGFLASDGLCHAFSDGGDGYVPGEGVGAVLLKPLSLAMQDRDHIYAVILGSAVSQDGKTFGYTVPNPKSQSEAIAIALEKAKVNPRTISYVEAHGTGTLLGDPVEIQGLQEVYDRSSQDHGYCAIGSVKSNIGHLEAAAGISQCVKVLLQMSNKTLVPSLIHGKGLNPNIDFNNSPFVVQQNLAAWEAPVLQENGKTTKLPRRAAISSFGAGGSNVHLIMEEYSPATQQRNIAGRVIIPLSAKSESELYRAASTLLEFLNNYADANPVTGEAITLDDLAYTLQVGRVAFKIRLAFVASSLTEVINNLASFVDKGRLLSSENDELAKSWVRCESVDWETQWKPYSPRRIYLPTHNFQKTACGARLDYSANPGTPVAEPQIANDEYLAILADLPAKEQLAQMIVWCQEQVGAILGYEPPNLPNPDTGFFEMGMESLQAIKLKVDAEKMFGVNLPDSAIFDYPTIRAIAPYILQLISWEKFEQTPNRPLADQQMSEDELVHSLEALLAETNQQEKN